MTQKRWKLSVTELGSSKVVAEAVVEAGDWMTALGRARGRIGEKGTVPQGASVSVSPEGRVTILDPVGRKQYRLAGTEEPLTAASAAPAPTSGPAGSPPLASGAPRGLAAAVDAALQVVATAPSAPSAPAASPPPGTVAGPAAPSPSPAVAAAAAPSSSPASGAPSSDSSGPASSGTKSPRATMAYLAPATAAQGPGESAAAPSAGAAATLAASGAAVSTPSAPTAQDTRAASSEALSLLFERDAEPSASAPLLYRERSWFVPEGTSIEQGETMLRLRFAQLRDELAGRPRGKLVKLALFDHRWTGQPQRPPVLVLTWKDWRGEPEVLVPGRAGAAASPSTPSSAAGAVPSAAASSAVSSPPAPSPAPASSIVVDPGLLAEASAAPRAASASVAPAAAVPSTPPPSASTPSKPPSASAPRGPSASAPAPRRSSGAPPPGDDRLATAFEGLQDLFFLPTPAEGADFVLRLLGELVPCEASAVALYDINTDELRFVAAHGVGADERKGDAVPAQAGILGAAIRLHEACTTVDELGADARFDPGVDGRVGLEATNTAVVGVFASGRLLGAFQLLNRIGDLEFGAADANLLVYVSNRFGAFLHQHKVAEVKRPSRTVTGRR